MNIRSRIEKLENAGANSGTCICPKLRTIRPRTSDEWPEVTGARQSNGDICDQCGKRIDWSNVQTRVIYPTG